MSLIQQTGNTITVSAYLAWLGMNLGGQASQNAPRDSVPWVRWYLPEIHGPFLSLIPSFQEEV